MSLNRRTLQLTVSPGGSSNGQDEHNRRGAGVEAAFGFADYSANDGYTIKVPANRFSFNPGPYFEIPLNRTFAFSLEGGVAMVYVWSNFRFDEEVMTSGGLMEVKGNSNNRDIEFGGYAGAKISAAISEQWSLFAGAQWQDVGTYEHRDRGTGETAVLDLSNSIFFTAGIGYSF